MTDSEKAAAAGSLHADLDETIPNIRVRMKKGELAAGDVLLNRYELTEKLGSGAMGVVFLCRDRVSGVQFALKMVPPELSGDQDVMENILANFRLVHNLHHKNIAGVEFLERDEYGRYFLIMEYAPGESLSAFRRKSGGVLTLAQTLPVLRQLGSALDYAHSQKVLHRDIKPANVMLSGSGEIKVLDLGLASEVRTSLTSMSIPVGNTSGTPNYMAPELFKGQYPRPASDQYALAVMVYELLSGHLPFGSSDFEILRSAVLQEQPEPIEGLPENVNQALLKALAKNPRERFENCSAFAEAMIKTAAEEKPPTPEPPPPRVYTEQQPPFPLGGAGEWREPPRVYTEQHPPVFKPAKAPDNVSKKIIFCFIAVVLGVIGFACISEVIWGQNKTVAPLIPTEQTSISDTRIVMLPGNVKLEMVKLEPGTFTMSARDGENDSDEVPHSATLTKPFYLGKTEVTQAQWQAVMGNNPSNWEGDNLPVEKVSWHDAMEFCEKLNKKGLAPQGWRFTLPTETQWEYAARGGNKSRGYKYSGCNSIDSVAWYTSNSNRKPHEVGGKAPNELGLYDMSGNVWELCLDDWHSKSSDAVPEFTRGRDSSSLSCVLRGGSWDGDAWGCRAASRDGGAPGSRGNGLGFRLALIPGQ